MPKPCCDKGNKERLHKMGIKLFQRNEHPPIK